MNIFTQEFRGNVTICPVPFNLIEFTKLVSNPTKQYIENCKVYGARKTYPKICKIEHLIKIENAIEKFYRKIKTKLNNKINEKSVKIEKPEKKFSFNELDDYNISENEDFDNISEKHNKFILYKENMEKQENKLIPPIKIIYKKDLDHDETLALVRNESFSTPRNISSVNI